jgi:hypothetical protein
MTTVPFKSSAIVHSFAMGADGGVITTRQDMVQRPGTSANSEAERERQVSISKSRWSECALTGMPLVSPIVIAKNGFFFNKSDLLEAIASRTVPRSLKKIVRKGEIRELDLLGSKSLLAYSCPLSAKSPSPGTVDPWVVFFDCGHLFHGPSLHVMASAECPVCGREFANLLEISPARR